MKIRRSYTDELIPYDLLLLSDDTKEAIDRNLDNSELYIAEIESNVIAAFILKDVENNTIEIKNIAVDEIIQGKGIGTILLDYIIQLAKERKYKTLLVGTCDQCFREIDFYKKSGFMNSGIRKDFFINNYEEPIYENGIRIRDMVMLTIDL